MIVGIGIDLIEPARIKLVHQKYGERFLNRIFTPRELFYCFKFADPYPHLAARFAAKEAISKALGTGIGKDLKWTDLEIINSPRGQPLVNLSERAKSILARLGGKNVFISLTHTTNYAAAVAIAV